MLIAKIIGIILIIMGGWMVAKFPFSADYQSNETVKTALTIGLALLIIGIVLLLI